jgi:TonB dependent receptor/Carboxypeptidase regulatory-like domain/TonB-dependent Receptor Plug Domain
MNKFRVALLLVVSMLLVAGAAFAQEAGAIVGTVTQGGTGLPGVTVEVRSANLQGVRTDVTDSNGGFRFPNLPAGDYNLTATLSGFNPVSQRNIRVGLNRTVTLEVNLSPQVSEQITVTGAAPVVDVTSTTAGVNVTSETMRSLPIGRNFTAVTQVAPGTSTDATGPTVYGSTGAENNYIIDGLNTTEVERGRQGKRLNFDFIQEVEVMTGGQPAEYGRMTGGIVNAITKSGSNEFHGDVFGYNSGGSFNADNETAADRPATATTIAETDSAYDLGANLGGYFIKDRLWFFGAYNRTNQTDLSIRINTPLNFPGVFELPVGGSVESEITRDLYAGKLSLAATPSHLLNLSVFGDPSTTEGAILAIAGAPSTWQGTIETGGADAILRYSGVFGTNWTLNASAGQHKETTEWGGAGASIGRLNDETVIPNVAFGGFGFIQNQEFTRDILKLDVSAFLGSHQFKFGADRENLKAENENIYTGSDRVRKRCRGGVPASGVCAPINIYYTHEGYVSDSTTNATLVNGLVIPSLVASPKTENTSFYVQDSWKVMPNFTLNLGVRWEEQKIGNREGEVAIDLDDMIAPRLGLIWDVQNNGRSKLYANYGRFFESIPMDINLRAFGGEISVQSNNLDPTPGHFTPAPVGPAGTGVPAQSGGRAFRFLGGHLVPVDPDLEGQHIDEYLAGYDYEIAPNLMVGVKGTYRKLGQVIEDMLVISEGDYFIANPGQGTGTVAGYLWGDEVPAEKAKRTYKGLEFHAQKRFSNNYQFFASYVWSRLEGNYDGTFQASTGQLDPNINSAYDYGDFAVNNNGLLSNDRTHQAKFYGSYTLADGFAKGLDLGAAFYWQSGAALTGQGYEFAGYRNYEYYLTERGSLGRGPSDYELDFHVGFPVAFGGGKRLNLLLDVFNVLNRQSITRLDNRMDLNTDSGCALWIKAGMKCGLGADGALASDSMGNFFGGWNNIPGTNTPRGKFDNPRAVATNPDFLTKGLAFTGVRSIRLGARFSF